MLHALLFVLALSGLSVGQQSPPPAQVPPASVQVVRQTPVQAPPFNEKADAKAAIESAVRSAALDGIRVLITWGANDDNTSKLFLTARRAPEIADARFFSDEYKPVNVNVGHLDSNLDLAKRYGATLKAGLLPALTVVDAAGKVIANTTAAALRPDSDPAGIDPVKLAAFLKSYQAPAPDAVAPFEAALKQAKMEGKTVFVWFSAPW